MGLGILQPCVSTPVLIFAQTSTVVQVVPAPSDGANGARDGIYIYIYAINDHDQRGEVLWVWQHSSDE